MTTLDLMKFNILVSEGPYTHQASDTAYQFVCAALRGGHAVVRVFFYHDGVYNASKLAVPPTDDRNVVERWGRLRDEYDIDLAVCVAAGQRRGMLDSSEASRHAKQADNIDKRFQVAGIGQFIEAAIVADRTIVFGD